MEAASDLTKILALYCSSNTVNSECPADSVDVMLLRSVEAAAMSRLPGLTGGGVASCWPSSTEMPERLKRKGSLQRPGLKWVGAEAWASVIGGKAVQGKRTAVSACSHACGK